MNNDKIKAVAYVRTASVKRPEQDNSTESQIKRISEYARSENVQIVKWFVQSGKNRPDLTEILEFCTLNKKVRQLYVTDIARISRSMEQYLKTKQLLTDYGITIKTCDSKEHDSPMAAFMDSLVLMTGQLDSSHRSDLAKQRMAERVAEGYSVTRPPLGYERTLVKGVYKPTRFGKSIGDILQTLADENGSLTGTIRVLQLALKRRTGKQTSNNEVMKTICNPYYAGYVDFQGKHYSGKHKPLLTREQYSAVLKIVVGSSYPLPKNFYCPVCSEL